MAAFPATATMTLSDYLAACARRRFELGTFDCAVFLADWAREVCGRDPLDGVRGAYATEREYLRLLQREDGFVASASRRLWRLGFMQVSEVRAGDVAVVLAPTRDKPQPTGAIVVSDTMRAVVTSDMGLVIAPNLPTLRAWRFANG